MLLPPAFANRVPNWHDFNVSPLERMASVQPMREQFGDVGRFVGR
ncbi:hypothetical protein SK875_B00728 [Burkholderia contaminans]|nr:hypothetical protein SK875_B00728 [Burkholderia contaminans]